MTVTCSGCGTSWPHCRVASLFAMTVERLSMRNANN